jgi:predicted kinase
MEGKKHSFLNKIAEDTQPISDEELKNDESNLKTTIDPLIREQKDVFEQTRRQGEKYGSQPNSSKKNPNKVVINLEEIKAKREKSTKNSENNSNNELLKDIAYRYVYSFLSEQEQEFFDKNKEKINEIIKQIPGKLTEDEWKDFISSEERNGSIVDSDKVSKERLEDIAIRYKNNLYLTKRERAILKNKKLET